MTCEQINEVEAAAIGVAVAEPVNCDETIAKAKKSLIISMVILMLAVIAAVTHTISFVPFVAVWVVFSIRAMDSIREKATAEAIKAIG